MSEYQYYEFRAVDRPLSQAERKDLRTISTRARITETSFVNSYDWGDFKGDPNVFMDRYFDLFLSFANWGSCRFAMRLPKQLLDPGAGDRFVGDEESAVIRTSGEHVIIDVFRDELEDWYDDEEDDDDSYWLDALAPLRPDVLDGDLRLLYLVWLMSVQTGVVPDDETEPLPGIAPLTASLEAFADFFCIDGDLVAAAARTGPQATTEPPRAAVMEIIESFDASQKAALLMRLYDGDPHLRSEFRRRCRDDAAPAADPQPRRTAAELRAFAQQLAEERRLAEAKRLEAEQRRWERQAAEAKRRRLDALAERGAEAWHEVETFIGLRNGPGYAKAVALLIDLRDLALRQGTDDEFHERLAALRARHSSKPRLIERMMADGLN
jgi:hypothetical protein